MAFLCLFEVNLRANLRRNWDMGDKNDGGKKNSDKKSVKNCTSEVKKQDIWQKILYDKCGFSGRCK